MRGKVLEENPALLQLKLVEAQIGLFKGANITVVPDQMRSFFSTQGTFFNSAASNNQNILSQSPTAIKQIENNNNNTSITNPPSVSLVKNPQQQ